VKRIRRVLSQLIGRGGRLLAFEEMGYMSMGGYLFLHERGRIVRPFG